MKLFKTGLHIFIAAISAVAFFGEWAALAHSLKPTQNTQAQSQTQTIDPLPTLPPIQSTFDNSGSSASTNNNNFGFQIVSPSSRARGGFGGLRTGGS